jgi:hypothetical protein
LVNNKDNIFYPVIIVLAVLGISHYFQFFDITIFTAAFFGALYNLPWLSIILVVLTLSLYYVAFNYFKSNLYLDTGLPT